MYPGRVRLSTILKVAAVSCFVGAIGLRPLMAIAPFYVPGARIVAAGLIPLAVYSLAALACAITLERGRLVGLMWSGIAASAIAVIAWASLAMATSMGRVDHEFWALLILFVNDWALLCAVIGLLMQRRLHVAWGVYARAVTIGLATLLAVLVPIAAWQEMEDPWGKLIAALAVLLTFGVFVTLILSRLRQIAGVKESQEVIRMPLTVTCPRCELRQDMVTGGDACNRCALQIKVMVP